MLRYFILFMLSINILYATITIQENTNNIKDFMLPYIHDSSKLKSIEEISSEHFTNKVRSQFTFGFKDVNTWFKFKIKNEGKQTRFILHSESSNAQISNLYYLDDEKWIEEKNGLYIPLKKRNIQSASPAYYLNINPGETKTYYLKTYFEFGIVSEFQIYTESTFLSDKRSFFHSIYMLVLGGVIVVFFLNLFLLITMKERIYAYYIGYVFFMGIFTILFDGTYIDLGLEKMRDLLFISTSYGMLFLILFSDSFLNIKNYLPFTSKILIFLTWIFAILGVIIFFKPLPWYHIMNNMTSLGFIVLLYASVRIWLKGNITAKYYFVLMLLNIIGLGLMGNVYMGQIENNDYTHYLFILFSFLEITFFSLILANRINEAYLEKNDAQELLLNEKEKYEILLEKEVKQRTKELEESQQLLKKHAQTDSLTGLYNRRYFTDSASKNFMFAKRYQENFCILMLDIDKFKNVNDNYGHLVGDDALILISTILMNAVRSSDLLARFGGEEFIILLPKTSLDKGIYLAEKIRTTVESKSLILPSNEKVFLTISIGISMYMPSTDMSLEGIILRADNKLYEAKENGRNRVC